MRAGGCAADRHCMAYAPSLGGIFLFDDIPAILQNESIRDLTQWSLVLAGADNPTTTGRPLLNLSCSRSTNLATIHDCDRLESRYPDEPLLYSLRGLAYFGLNDRPAAEREARIALSRGFDSIRRLSTDF